MSNNTLEPKELTQAIAKLVSIGEDMRAHLLRQARDAADAGETNWLVHVSNEASEIDDSIVKLRTLGDRFREILTSTLGFEDGYLDKHEHFSTAIDSVRKAIPAKSVAKHLRRIRTSITQGEINQNLLTLTEARKRGLIRMGEQFRIRLPGGEEIETELVQPGNKLRERGRIGEFYRQNKINPGDHVLLEEIEPGFWTLTKEQTITPGSADTSILGTS